MERVVDAHCPMILSDMLRSLLGNTTGDCMDFQRFIMDGLNLMVQTFNVTMK